MTIAKLELIRRLLLQLVSMVEDELRVRGVPVRERTITHSDYQRS